MKQLVIDLVNFVNSSEVGQTLTPAIGKLDNRSLRVIAIKLLGWLGRKTLTISSHPYLELQADYSWCEPLKLLFKELPEMSELFLMDNSKVEFRPEVSADERREINTFVRSNFRPPLMT